MEAGEGLGLEPSAEGGRERLRLQGHAELLPGCFTPGPTPAGLPLCRGPTAAGVALLRLRAAASLSRVGDGGSGSSSELL